VGTWSIAIPEATTNLVTNPSFVVDTTGWTNSGLATFERVTTDSKFGIACLHCVANSQNDEANETLSSLTTAGTFTTAAWVKTADSDVQLRVTSSPSGDELGTANHTGGDTWERLEVSGVLSAGESAMVVAIRDTSASGWVDYYADAVQVEEKSYSTTYCDGDQGGCEWTGTKHGSTSTRDALSRAGGRWRDLADYYGLVVERQVGIGAASVENAFTTRIATPGGVFESLLVPPRVFALTSTIRGSSLSDYHDQRNLFLSDIAPDGNPNDEPMLFKYTGATIDKEIKARYAGGMTMSGPDGFAETVAIQFVAGDPMFTQIGEKSAILDTNDVTAMDSATYRTNGIWTSPSNPSTGVNDIWAFAEGLDKLIYMGGDFVGLDGVTNADYIASWDGTTWAALGTGMNSTGVRAITLRPDGNLLAGGGFTTSGGTTTRGIAEWNGSAWSALGPPSAGGDVYAVAIGLDGLVYVGGNFTNFDSADANTDYIASWNGSAWDALGASGGANAHVRDLVVDSNGDLIIVGDFTSIGGVSATGVAKWDGSAFTALSTGTTNGDVVAAYITSAGELFVTGDFTTIDGVSANYIAAWNGATFEPLDSGLQSNGDDLTEWRGFLVVAGIFTAAGGIGLNNGLAFWNGFSWLHPDVDLPSTAAVTFAAGDDLWAGYSGLGNANHAGTTSITPAGNSRAWPIIQISRSGGTSAGIQNIINETTRKYLWADYNLLDGETITIDTRPGQVNASSNYRGNIVTYFPGSDMNDFYLLPGVANDIKCFVNAAGSPTITATIRWKDTYWSVD
jgi:hypothetical protein